MNWFDKIKDLMRFSSWSLSRQRIKPKSFVLLSMLNAKTSHVLKIFTRGEETFFFYNRNSPSRITTRTHISANSLFTASAWIKYFFSILNHFISQVVVFFIMAITTQPFYEKGFSIVGMMSVRKCLLITTETKWITN